MKYIFTIVVSLAASCNAYAWVAYTHTDRMTDEVDHFLMSNDNDLVFTANAFSKPTIGFGCAGSPGEVRGLLLHLGTSVLFETEVRVRIRVDKNPLIAYTGQVLDDKVQFPSNHRTMREILDQFKEGSTVLINAHEDTHEFALLGFAVAYEEFMELTNNCKGG